MAQRSGHQSQLHLQDDPLSLVYVDGNAAWTYSFGTTGPGYTIRLNKDETIKQVAARISKVNASGLAIISLPDIMPVVNQFPFGTSAFTRGGFKFE